jgi:3-oxoacyl-(acyl-carrier-protein) synthase
LGAAGGFEAVACVKTLESGIIAPTINFETPDPDCDLDYCFNKVYFSNNYHHLNHYYFLNNIL